MKQQLLLRLPLAFVFFIFLSAEAQVIQTNALQQNPAVDYKRLARIDTLINEYVKKIG
jgi:hypothetical protein